MSLWLTCLLGIVAGTATGAAFFGSLHLLTQRLAQGRLGPGGLLLWQGLRMALLVAVAAGAARQGAAALLALAAGLVVGRTLVLAAVRRREGTTAP